MLIYSIFLYLYGAVAEFNLDTISGISNNCHKGGWVKLYQQSASSIWHAGAMSWCKPSKCLYSPIISTDYLNFDIISSYEGNGYAFLMAWDDTYWIQWKQKDNPLALSADSKPDPLSGDFEFTLVASDNIRSWGIVDFHGLSYSSDSGVILDGRSSMGTWFAIGVTEAANADVSYGIPGWITGTDPEYAIKNYAQEVKLYVWDPICGNWGNFPTESPTTPFPTVPQPTFQPTTLSPTVSPSIIPTESPTKTPTMPPTEFPTVQPTIYPTTSYPTHSKTSYPTTSHPTEYPTLSKTSYPTTSVPTNMPTYRPSEFIDSRTSITPTFTPTISPTINTTLQPTAWLPDLGTQPAWTSSIIYVSLVFFFTGFVSLVCLLLLCTVIKRNFRRETLNKPLKINETTPKSANRKDSWKMDKDLLTTAKGNVTHESYRNLNGIPPYKYQMPILGQSNSNVEYLQKNGVLRMSSQNFMNHCTGQPGVPAQCFCGLRPCASEPIHSLSNSYNMRLREVAGGTGEIFTDENVTIPSVRIFTPRDGKYVSKSLSRGRDSRSAQETILRANACFSNQNRIRYSSGTEYLSNYPVSSPLSEKRLSRKNRKAKKIKRRKSRTRKLKKSISWGTRYSSSEEEYVRATSPKSMMLGDRTPLGPEESDCETAVSSTDDREFSSSTDSVYNSTPVPVHELKQVKKLWSEKDIVREIQKELDAENLQVVTKGNDIEWGCSRPTPGLRIAISKETAISRVRPSKSRSNSKNIIQQREDVSSKVQDATPLEKLSTASSSSESSASSYSRGSIEQHLDYPKYDSLDSSKMKEAAIDMRHASLKIPKNLKELQAWHNNMLNDIPEKYFIEEFLDAGILPPNTLGMGPSKLESQSALELSTVE